MTEDLLGPSSGYVENLEPALGDAEPSLADIANQGADSRCKKCILSGTDDHFNGKTRDSNVTPASAAATDLSSPLDSGFGRSDGVNSNSGNGNPCLIEDNNNVSIQEPGGTLTSHQHEVINLDNNINNNIQEEIPSDTNEMLSDFEHVYKTVNQHVPLSPTITTDTTKMFDKTLVKEFMDSSDGSNGSNSTVVEPDIFLDSEDSEPESSPDSDMCVLEYTKHTSGSETTTSETEPDNIPGPDISPNSDVSEPECSPDADACMSEYGNNISNYETPTSEPEPGSSSERESNPPGSSVPAAESSNIPTGTMVTCRVELNVLIHQILKDHFLSRPVQQCTDHEPRIYSQMDIVATPNPFPWQPYENMRKPLEESSVLVIGAHTSDTASLIQPTQPRPPEPKFHEPICAWMQDPVPLMPSHDYQMDVASHWSYKNMQPFVKSFNGSYGNQRELDRTMELVDLCGFHIVGPHPP